MSGWISFEIEDAMKANAITLANKFKLDFSVSSLKLYDQILNNMKRNGAKSTDFEKDNKLTLCGSYLGEVICRLLGGKWMAFGDGYTMNQPRLSLPLVNIIDEYYANPISEIAWKLDHGPDNRIIIYFQGLSDELVEYKIAKGKPQNVKDTYNYIFPDDYFDFICDLRDYEANKFGHPRGYITLPVESMNEAIKKRR